jgi:GxxExxY protein
MKMLDDNSDLLKVLRCAFEVYATLKYGYLESVYEAALEYELLQAGFSVSRQVRIPVFYKGVELKKDFYADMIVDGRIILELKVWVSRLGWIYLNRRSRCLYWAL